MMPSPAPRVRPAPGEKLFSDHGGQMVPVIDAHPAEVRDADIALAVLNASNDTCAEAREAPTFRRPHAFLVGLRAFGRTRSDSEQLSWRADAIGSELIVPLRAFLV